MRKKTRKTVTDGNDKFYDMFVGEYLQFILKHKYRKSVIDEETQSVVEVENYTTVNGYLLEYDEDHYYLGQTALAVTHSIKKEDYFIAVISNPEEFNMDELSWPKTPPEYLN